MGFNKKSGTWIKIKFDAKMIRAKLNNGINKGVAPLMTQVLKDSNYYCRQDTGMLIASSLIASSPKTGVLVWNTPYAKKVYYTGKPSHDVNSNASLMWFEKAKAEHNDEWMEIAQKLMNKEV
jgi:hypothetical protein